MFRFLGRRSRKGRGRVPLTLYTRPDCPLCDEMKAEIALAGLSEQYVMHEVNIERDETLVAAYGRSIPVLEIAGRPAFKGRLTARAFRTKFERLRHGSGQREPGGAV